MTDEETRSVYEQVEAILMSREGRGLDIGNPDHLTFLSDATRIACPDTATDELLLITAMCWLGPPTAGPPPSPTRTAALELFRQLIADERERLERVMEFVIAYGCGKWRKPQAGLGGWEHRWQGTMRGLVRALEPAVGQSNRWLAEHVPGFPQNRSIPHDPHFIEDTATWSDAWLLANKIARPEDLVQIAEGKRLTIACAPEGTACSSDDQEYEHLILPGAKSVWTLHSPEIRLSVANRQPIPIAMDTTVTFIARDEDVLIKIASSEQSQQIHLKMGEEAEAQGPLTLGIWECACGTTHCAQRHRLESWNPLQKVQKTVTDSTGKKKEETALTLWNFVASAVKGPQAQLQTGSFVQGLYFSLLSQEGC